MIELLGLPEASTYAGDIDRLFTMIFWIVAVWFLLAEGVFFYFILRFRKKDGVRAQYVSGELKSEKRWITIPHNLILLFDVLILVFAVKVWYTVKQDLPDAPDKRVVRIIGQQWAWTFVDPGPDGQLDTPDDIAKVNEMHVVVDKIHHFKLESKDVVHSFSVPAFRLKQDVVPGRTITAWFKATATGRHDIQCTQICGIGHGLMSASLYIETPEQHEAWLKDHSALAAAGAQ